MKRTLITIVILALIPTILFPFLVKNRLAQEGYNSWEAVRNYLLRSGEVQIRLPEEFIITHATSNKDSDPIINDNIAIFEIGYAGNILFDIRYQDANGDYQDLSILTDKLNSWNRIHFSLAQAGEIIMVENGIPQRDAFRITKNTTEQGAAANP